MLGSFRSKAAYAYLVKVKRRPGASTSGPDDVFLLKAPLPSVQDQRCYAITRLNIILQANGLHADPST